MKAADFMVGDWYANSDGDLCKVVKNLGNIVCGQGDDVSDSTDDPNPILLTSEILEKNGFVQIEDGFANFDLPEGCWQNDNALCGINFNDRAMFYTFSIDPEDDNLQNKIIGICFVYQLQQALRLCGLNELADNFKV